MSTTPAQRSTDQKPSSIERIQRLERLERERLEEKERKDERRRQTIAGAKPAGGRHDLVDRIEGATKYPMAILGVALLAIFDLVRFVREAVEIVQFAGQWGGSKSDSPPPLEGLGREADQGWGGRGRR